jgi:dTDP-4-dehydrorhamnose 3,5-epimerase
MEFLPTAIKDILIIKPQLFHDERGYFMETFQTIKFHDAGLPDHFVQDNHVFSHRGTLRGLHYQVHQAQGKLTRVVAGTIFDVAVDIRSESPTFGKWVGIILSARDKAQLWIPPGFAHGYFVLSRRAEVIYKVTDYYAPQWERTILWNDPDIAIEWPISENVPLILSRKDSLGELLKDAELFS